MRVFRQSSCRDLLLGTKDLSQGEHVGQEVTTVVSAAQMTSTAPTLVEAEIKSRFVEKDESSTRSKEPAAGKDDIGQKGLSTMAAEEVVLPTLSITRQTLLVAAMALTYMVGVGTHKDTSRILADLVGSDYDGNRGHHRHT